MSVEHFISLEKIQLAELASQLDDFQKMLNEAKGDLALLLASSAPPPIGTGADAVSLGVSIGRGDWGGAFLDVLGFVPIVGDGIKGAVKGTKLAKKITNITEAMAKARKKIADRTKNIRKNAQKKCDKLVKNTKKRKSDKDATTDCGTNCGGGKNINPNKTVGGRKIINSDLAGKTVKTKGGDVKFDNDGFPDFTPNSKKTVRVDGLTGDMANDVPLAMEKAGLKTYDKKKHVWHHHQDGKSMMLVPRDVHSVRNGGVAHTGGRAVIEHNKNNPTNPLNYPSPPEI